METTQNGIKIPTSQDIYNVAPYNDNAKILDEHLSDTDIHVNASKIAEIAESVELTQIDSTDTNSTMWGKIKKSISELNDHVEEVASETKLGHIKIGVGLQMTDDVASVKIANDLVTNDEKTALSAAKGAELNIELTNTNSVLSDHVGKIATTSTLGHIKIGTGLQMSGDVANVKIANNLTTNDPAATLSAAMGVELKNNLVKVTSMEISTGNLSPGDNSVVLNYPAGAKQVLAVVVNGWQPVTSWDTKILVKSIAINTNTCSMYIEGGRTQSYALRYNVFYL